MNNPERKQNPRPDQSNALDEPKSTNQNELQARKRTNQMAEDKILPLNEHIDLLINVDNRPCDGTDRPLSDSRFQNTLPPWFDQKKYERGQKYFNDQIFAMYAVKLSGLVSVIAIPSVLKILIFTNKSSTAHTAYKRYVATILYMLKWYDHDFNPKSESWKSLLEVRRLHFSSSNKSRQAGKGQITHRDMALTQFGFIGFGLVRGEWFGLDVDDKDGVEGWVHFWRVLGWCLGIEDRYNLCRESVPETKTLCNALIEKFFANELRTPNPDFIHMYTELLKAFWPLNPTIYVNTWMLFLFKMTSKKTFTIDKTRTIRQTPRLDLNVFHVAVHKFQMTALTSWYRVKFSRWLLNMNQRLGNWLMVHFPFLAFFCFGRDVCVELYQSQKAI